MVDRVVATLALVVLTPALLVISLAIRLDSAGPALHRATRVGVGGRTFTLLKFRTMVRGASGGSKVTAWGDRRITRTGRLLRATKLDELPQLVNVLRGEMRLVGWRPEDPAYIDPADPNQTALLEHLPGITSPASVAFRHEERTLAGAVARGGDIEMTYRRLAKAKSKLDLDYLRSRTLFSDVGVFVDTLRSVVKVGAPPAAGLDDVYRTYEGDHARRWSSDRPGNVEIARERERVASLLLGSMHLPGGRVLDIGAGTGGGFPGLFPEAFRIRLDILLWRLRPGGPGGSRGAAVCADGTALPHPDASIDVALVSVVLSSIPEGAGRALLAEVERVVRPGGVVIVYDFRVPNPSNRATRAVSRRWITGALPGFRTHARSVTLAPPVARRLGAHTTRWYRPLGRLRLTRTHNVIVGRRCAG